MYFIKTELPRFIGRACTICISMSFVLLILGNLFALKQEVLALDLSDYSIFLVLSAILSASFYVFRIPIAKIFSTILHFALCAIGVFSTFGITEKIRFDTTAKWFVAIVLFAFLYAALYGVYILFRFLIQKFPSVPKQKEASASVSQEYKKRF